MMSVPASALSKKARDAGFREATVVSHFVHLFTAKSEVEAPPKTISLDLPDCPVANALREIADLFDLNVVIPDSLQGRTSVKLRNVTWQQAFKVILEPVGYTYVEDGMVIKVISSKPTISQSQNESFNWLNGPWYIGGAVALFYTATVVCHLAFFIGIIGDDDVAVRFAPRWIWALLVLVGGIVPLAGYWLIHHSNLRTNDNTGRIGR